MAGIHDGQTIPLEEPKDPDSYGWYGFSYVNSFAIDETITSDTWLVNGTPITVGGTVDTITLHEVKVETNTAQALVSGGIEGYRYELTNRITTNYLPSVDKTLYFMVQTT